MTKPKVVARFCATNTLLLIASLRFLCMELDSDQQAIIGQFSRLESIHNVLLNGCDRIDEDGLGVIQWSHIPSCPLGERGNASASNECTCDYGILTEHRLKTFVQGMETISQSTMDDDQATSVRIPSRNKLQLCSNFFGLTT